jgi:DNA-directed RNA polymerase specialized sigma24 family protein
LPDRDRELLVLKEVEGFSVQELAEILNVNVNTVKVRLFRTRARLMDLYRHRLNANFIGPAAKGRFKSDGSGI